MPAMPPFDMTGKATRELPGADGGDKQRTHLERRHAAEIRKVFAMILDKIAALSSLTPDSAWSAYQDAAPLLKDALLPMLEDGATLGLETGKAQVAALMGGASKPSPYAGVNWDLANQNVIDWIQGGGGTDGQGYIDYLTDALGETSANLIRHQVGEWTQAGTPLQELIDQLQGTVFSSARAEAIAQTEITRAYAEANRAAWRESGEVEGMRWETNNDELVCAVCGPLNGQVAPIDGDFDGLIPPAHPRCRCWLVPAVRLQ